MVPKNDKKKSLFSPKPNANTLPGQGGGMSPDAMSALGMGAQDPAAGSAPQDPMAAAASPGAPDAAAASGMASPDQMAELQQMFGQVKGANSQLASKQLISRNEIASIRQQLMVKMFQIMQEAGVDPGDPQAIQSFLQQLEKQDPALLQLFQDAFHVISEQTNGGQDMSGSQDMATTAGNPNATASGDPNATPDQGAMGPDSSGAMPPMPGQEQSGMSPLTSRFQNLQRME